MFPLLLTLTTELHAYAHAIDSIRMSHGREPIPVFIGENPDRQNISFMKTFTFRGVSRAKPSTVLSNIEEFITGNYDAIYLNGKGDILKITLVRQKRKEYRRINLKQEERNLFDALNAYRHSRGLKPLTWSRKLHSLALRHSRDMSRRGKLDHRGFGNRFEESGFNRCVENVALTPVEQVGTAIDLWKESRGHRKNMMDRHITHGAIAIDTAQAMAYITFFACGK